MIVDYLLQYNFRVFTVSYYLDDYYLNVLSMLSGYLISLSFLFFTVYLSLVFLDYTLCSISITKSSNISDLLDDIFFLNFLFLLINLFWFRYSIYNFICIINNYWDLIILVIIYFISTVIQLGIFFIIFTKGSGQSLSHLYNIVVDSINSISFTSRFVIQFIRLVLCYLSVYSLNMLSCELLVLIPSSYNLFYSTLNYIYIITELAHFFFLVSIQLSIFFFFFKWLFEFLMSCNSKLLS